MYEWSSNNTRMILTRPLDYCLCQEMLVFYNAEDSLVDIQYLKRRIKFIFTIIYNENKLSRPIYKTTIFFCYTGPNYRNYCPVYNATFSAARGLNVVIHRYVWSKWYTELWILWTAFPKPIKYPQNPHFSMNFSYIILFFILYPSWFQNYYHKDEI